MSVLTFPQCLLLPHLLVIFRIHLHLVRCLRVEIELPLPSVSMTSGIGISPVSSERDCSYFEWNTAPSTCWMALAKIAIMKISQHSFPSPVKARAIVDIAGGFSLSGRWTWGFVSILQIARISIFGNLFGNSFVPREVGEISVSAASFKAQARRQSKYRALIGRGGSHFYSLLFKSFHRPSHLIFT